MLFNAMLVFVGGGLGAVSRYYEACCLLGGLSRGDRL